MSIVSLPQHLNSRTPGEGINGPAPNGQLEMAAEQFEALFLQQVLKQMRKAGDVLSADSPLRSRELDTMRDFYDGVLAETLAGKKQTGIADLLVKQLSGNGGQSASIRQADAALSSEGFKAASETVALTQKGTSSVAEGTRQYRSAAFAQPVRIERKEID